MRKSFNGMVFVASAASLSVIATVAVTSARADTLEMPAAASPAAAGGMPQRGESMSEVVEHFGQPSEKHAAVGGDAPHHPPITRWDYPGYSVFFERRVVLDTVVPGREPGLQHTDELAPNPGHGG